MAEASYDSILVPVDASEAALATLDHAVPLARCHGAELHVLYVVDRRHYLAADRDTQGEVLAALEDEGDEAVAAARDRIEDADVTATTAVREGVPYREILDYVDDPGVDCVAMGTHGRTGRDRVVRMGSVTDRVVENAGCPVLVVDVGVDDTAEGEE